jgi:integrase
VRPDQAEARRAIAVPFKEAAMEALMRQKGNCFVRVFIDETMPVKQVSTQAWYKAMKRAGFENFRWQDMRHTWAS